MKRKKEIRDGEWEPILDINELSKETLKNIKQAQRDIKEGRVYTHEQVKEMLGLHKNTQKMEALLCVQKSKELEQKVIDLGYKALFEGSDFVIIDATTPKELQKKAQAAKKKKLQVYFAPKDEKMLRFALERSAVDVVFDLELIHRKDSMHYLRAGLDQVLCKIAKEKSKVIGFSFDTVLNGKNQARVLARMQANMKICKKYKVETKICLFTRKEDDLRLCRDVESLFRTIKKNG